VPLHTGIIQTEQGDDGSNVELVKQLVQQYISSDRAIIVATITCKDDIDNQVRTHLCCMPHAEQLSCTHPAMCGLQSTLQDTACPGLFLHVERHAEKCTAFIAGLLPVVA
jgi:hypothetical protein